MFAHRASTRFQTCYLTSLLPTIRLSIRNWPNHPPPHPHRARGWKPENVKTLILPKIFGKPRIYGSSIIFKGEIIVSGNFVNFHGRAGIEEHQVPPCVEA